MSIILGEPDVASQHGLDHETLSQKVNLLTIKKLQRAGEMAGQVKAVTVQSCQHRFNFQKNRTNSQEGERELTS